MKVSGNIWRLSVLMKSIHRAALEDLRGLFACLRSCLSRPIGFTETRLIGQADVILQAKERGTSGDDVNDQRSARLKG